MTRPELDSMSLVPGADSPARTIDEQLVVEAFARVRPLALGIGLGVVMGVLVFAATALVLVEASLGKASGHVGPHLHLLHYFLPGYNVSWPGACVGLGWGFMHGLVLGGLMAGLVNLHHRIYIRRVARRLRAKVLSDGL